MLGIMLGQGIAQKLVQSKGVKNSKKLEAAKALIVKIISNNNSLLTQIVKAYEMRNTQLMNSLFMSEINSRRGQSILKEIASNDEWFNRTSAEIDKEQTQLANKVSDAELANSKSGSSIADNRRAGEVARMLEEQAKYSETTSEHLHRLVQGGLNNVQTQK